MLCSNAIASPATATATASTVHDGGRETCVGGEKGGGGGIGGGMDVEIFLNVLFVGIKDEASV